MKAATITAGGAASLVGARVADYLELIRLRMSLLVLFTVAAGALLASDGLPDAVQLFHVLLGTALVAAGASALNQLLERHTDALMARTENRPLPAGRLSVMEVSIFGSLLAGGGIAYLLLTARHPLAAGVAAFTCLGYVFVYTPLKRKTPLNTLVGAVPGALPPVIGWTAVRGSIDREALALFLIVFLWQVPHFLAIAWIYRDQYARAGLCMLPVIDADGSQTGRQMFRYAAVLIPASLGPVLLGSAGLVYAAAALVLGVGFLLPCVAFARDSTASQARRVLRASLLYLPLLLLVLLLDSRSPASVLAATLNSAAP
jgi:protoheme IX farnesyltransferase